jgi:hypothetical protein
LRSRVVTPALRLPQVSPIAASVPFRATPTGSAVTAGRCAACFAISAIRGSRTSPSTAVRLPAIAWMRPDGRLMIIWVSDDWNDMR